MEKINEKKCASEWSLSFSLSLSLSQTHTHTHTPHKHTHTDTRTHKRTHTHIYIYITMHGSENVKKKQISHFTTLYVKKRIQCFGNAIY